MACEDAAMIPSARFRDALVFACELHAQQRRKGTDIPYVAHLLAVTAIALEHGATEDEAIAAALHDAVEDQGGAPTLEEIRRRFGDAVASIVEHCSDTDEVPKPPWRARKEAYIARLATAPRSALLVSASDKLHNARSILCDARSLGDALWPRFAGGRDGTLWYYRALVTAFQAALPGPLVDELDRVVCEIERLSC